MGYLYKRGRKFYHVVSIVYHEYEKNINACKDHKCLEATVSYGTFQFSVLVSSLEAILKAENMAPSHFYSHINAETDVTPHYSYSV